MWLSTDPLFEKYMGMSPYQYCNLNPLRFVDPTGMAGWEVQESNGAMWYNENLTSENVAEGFKYFDSEVSASLYSNSIKAKNWTKDKAKDFIDGSSQFIDKSFKFAKGISKEVGKICNNVSNGYVNTMERADDWANEFGSTLGNCLFYTDAYSLYFSYGKGKGYKDVGVVGNVMLELTYMKGKGLFLASTEGIGLGYDQGGIAIGAKFSKYYGSQSMTIDSYGGSGSSYSLGAGYIDAGLSISKDGNWRSLNLGWQKPALSISYTWTSTQILKKF